MSVPVNPKIYHIVHVDKLPSIISENGLLCDAEIARRDVSGTAIGIPSIKQRRLKELTLASHPGLYVGDCVPFYFCPRSVMLYVIYMGNHPELPYHDGQDQIVHLEADLHKTVAWADGDKRRWAFTTSNAGAYYFEDYSDIGQLDKIQWDAVEAIDWKTRQDGKQAEFLVEQSLPWELISRVGVMSRGIYDRALEAVQVSAHRPTVEIMRDWYY